MLNKIGEKMDHPGKVFFKEWNEKNKNTNKKKE